MANDPKRSTSIAIDPALLARVDAFAELADRSRSQIVAYAIAEFLARRADMAPAVQAAVVDRIGVALQVVP